MEEKRVTFEKEGRLQNRGMQEGFGVLTEGIWRGGDHYYRRGAKGRGCQGRRGLLEKGEEGLKRRGTIEGWPILLSSYSGAE